MLDAAAKDSWETIVRTLRAFVEKRVGSNDADDVLQDVLLRIHASLARLDDGARFGPWAYAIARNAVIDHYRKRSVVERSMVRPPVDSNETLGGADDDERPLLDCVAPFVARLPSPYREAVTLVELEGLTQSAAAEIAGVSLSGMKSRVQRGRRLLRALLEECCVLTIDARGRVCDAERRCAACDCSTGGSRPGS